MKWSFHVHTSNVDWKKKLIGLGADGGVGVVGVGMHDFRLHRRPENCVYTGKGGGRKTYMCTDKWNFHVL